MVNTTTTGVNIIKEVTENTCEWQWVQQADLDLSGVPKKIIVFLGKRGVKKSEKMQTKFRRNGTEVDRERANALAKVMIARRGEPLMEDQKTVFEGCEELLGGGNVEGDEEWKFLVSGWKVIKSPSPDVRMWIK